MSPSTCVARAARSSRPRSTATSVKLSILFDLKVKITEVIAYAIS
jgi:hypothetical protein